MYIYICAARARALAVARKRNFEIDSEIPTDAFLPATLRLNNMPVEYVVVRHSERLDHYYGESWRERWHEQEFFAKELTVPAEHASALLVDQRNTTPLSRHGLEYARQSGEALKAMGPFDLVVTSPMLRCIQTADTICSVLGEGQRFGVEVGLMELMDPEFYGEFTAEDPCWPSIEAVYAAFPRADQTYDEVMPATELELPPNEYFHGFVNRIMTVRARIERKLGRPQGVANKNWYEQHLKVLVVAHSPHIPCWFFNDLNGFGGYDSPHNGYCTIATMSEGASGCGGLTVTQSTDHLVRDDELFGPAKL